MSDRKQLVGEALVEAHNLDGIHEELFWVIPVEGGVVEELMREARDSLRRLIIILRDMEG